MASLTTDIEHRARPLALDFALVACSDALPDDGLSKTFHAARAGIHLDLPPRVTLDVHGNYRVDI